MANMEGSRTRWAGRGFVLACLASASGLAFAQGEGYRVNAGDVLGISVWGEEELTADVLVGPDGSISFPLAGVVEAEGQTISQITDEVAGNLSRYIPEPVVTVSLAEISGNKIYVIGQVNRAGEYVMNPSLDVMQALSLAGGTTTFADLKGIVILRRTEEGQEAIRFPYNDIVDGRNLERNIVLQSGDTVVVP